MNRLSSPQELQELKAKIIASHQHTRCIGVCSGTGCLAFGAQKIVTAFQEEIARKGLQDTVEIRPSGCYGFCERGPLVVILPEQTCYLNAREKDIPEIVAQTIQENKITERLVYKDLDSGEPIATMEQIPFYKHQKRILLANNGNLNPKKIEDYIAIGGYSALAKVLGEKTPAEVIDEVKKSKLRGRGGAGFPTGAKWEATSQGVSDDRYVIVNADEGDPGAYMDRSLLEGNPHGIIEGLIIGAFAIGAHEGFIYVRQEYPLAVENTEIAIEQARNYGLLGKNILGSGFDFDITIHRGAGAFVSGESSALINAIEGKVGEPRLKYVRNSVKGLWEKPTCINNVETWANIPFIIARGADWFTTMGTENSTGTKIFSLVGKVNNTGLVEVPMGITLRQIVYDIGGGIPNNKKFKAVQTGGPSGGVLPESMLDLPVDFDELIGAGSMMGSGGLIVMDQDTCMVDIARYYTQFLAKECCGKCVPCREGLRRTLEILDNIVMGQGREGDIELLEELGEFMKKASLCGLGQTAANPVLSTIRYFRDEYQAHIKDKWCSAGVCKQLFSYRIDKESCQACGLCAKECPTGAISKIDGVDAGYAIDEAKCIRCGSCRDICPTKPKSVLITQCSAATRRAIMIWRQLL